MRPFLLAIAGSLSARKGLRRHERAARKPDDLGRADPPTEDGANPRPGADRLLEGSPSNERRRRGSRPVNRLVESRTFFWQGLRRPLRWPGRLSLDGEALTGAHGPG